MLQFGKPPKLVWFMIMLSSYMQSLMWIPRWRRRPWSFFASPPSTCLSIPGECGHIDGSPPYPTHHEPYSSNFLYIISSYPHPNPYPHLPSNSTFPIHASLSNVLKVEATEEGRRDTNMCKPQKCVDSTHWVYIYSRDPCLYLAWGGIYIYLQHPCSNKGL